MSLLEMKKNNKGNHINFVFLFWDNSTILILSLGIQRRTCVDKFNNKVR